MGKYNWTIDTLQSKLNLIEKLIELETDPTRLLLLQNDYYTLQNHINDFFDFRPLECLKLLDSFHLIKDDLKLVEFLWSDFRNFTNIFGTPIEIPPLKRQSLSNSDLLDITHDFYKSLNKFFFANFMKNFRRRADHIVFRNYNEQGISGETITLPSLKESYIEILRDHNYEDVLTTIHEYSHATSVSINPRHLHIEKCLFTEIDSLFMELIASDFIDKLFKSQTSTILKAKQLNGYCSEADDICVMLDAIKHEPEEGYKSNKQFKQIAIQQYDVLPDEIDAIILNPNMNSLTYLTSYMFALELYKMYLEDKEKALYYLKKIILLECKSELEYYCNIKRFGIIPNLSFPNYYQELQQEIAKLTRKKPNI